MNQNISLETLLPVLTKKLGKKIRFANYQITRLHGGTLGEVKLVTGTATTTDSEALPYKLVWKRQKKWERYGDPGSWRREYDLYSSDLGMTFSDSFRWPDCYLAEMNEEENEIQIWMEYIEGVTGLKLTGEMYERAAEELGRFQGKLYAEQPAFLQNLTNLSKVGFVKDFYERYRSWKKVYDYVRSGDCEIPKHICQMLIDIDKQADVIFNSVEKLPIVLCHRDFWVANLFCTCGEIVLIDWDTTGWGYLGEDIASLIADEADVEQMVQYYHRCVPAYYKGFSEYADISHITNHCVRELILVKFGYRLIEWYIDAGSGNKRQETTDEKELQLNTLQKIYEMGI
ncbi:MAG: aminoglycoside phosphotransferase family protein [Bacillota bacterium]|nr:aminoglycoside phosphotransferase family protein [Bacillota bacterium]